jgi:hypothetical protein
MNDFVSIEILGTMTGCSFVITLLTQVFKRFLPEKIDTKWLALLFSIIVGTLRIFYVGQFDFAGIVSGIINIFILLAASIGIYEIGNSTGAGIKAMIGGTKDDKK